MEAEFSHEILTQLSGFVSQTTGLYFPQDRWPELQRSIAAATRDLGFEDDFSRCIRWLAAGPSLSKPQFESLVSHLTVGETYFFRERRHFDFLTERILPELMKREGERRLRIWSAACCTGEEAYSIAISLRRAIPDLDRWHVTLLATDINPHFLRKAEAGVFSQWSFRDAPDWLKPQYFRAIADGKFEISPDIKRLVKFIPLNLATDVYPSLLNDAHAMDVVFCRNVLMYFASSLARKVVENIHRAQREGGWLFVSSSELLHLTGSSYMTVNTPDMVVYRKAPASGMDPFPPLTPALMHPVTPQIPPTLPVVAIQPDVVIVEESTNPQNTAMALYAEGYYQKAADILDAWLSTETPERADAVALNLLARCLANQGRLIEALARCDQSITIDKCNPASQYLRAIILQEQGAIDEAILTLRNVLYLDSHFVLAHVALGTLSQDRGQIPVAHKHLRHALEMLQDLQPDAAIPESEGMTAGRLTNMIHSLMHEEVVP